MTIASRPTSLGKLLHEVVEPFASIDEAELGPLLERIGDSKVVLLGEATHGTSEFYRMRARITQELVRWFDRTSAVSPLGARPEPGVPDTYPFGL